MSRAARITLGLWCITAENAAILLLAAALFGDILPFLLQFLSIGLLI